MAEPDADVAALDAANLAALRRARGVLGMDLLGRIDPALSTKAKVDHTGIPATQVHVHQAKGLPDKELFATRDAALAKAFGVG